MGQIIPLDETTAREISAGWVVLRRDRSWLENAVCLVADTGTSRQNFRPVSPLTATYDIRLPRDLRRTPLPDTEGDNTGEPGWNTGQSRDFDVAIHQRRRFTASPEVVVRAYVTEVEVRNKKRDDWNRQHGE